jgi:hypothetical protein
LLKSVSQEDVSAVGLQRQWRGERRSLRDICAVLSEAGRLNEYDRPFNSRSNKAMIQS